MVFICIARQLCMYVEGWRDSRRRRRRAREEKAENEQRSDRRKRKARTKRAGGGRKGKRIVAKGRYTLILQEAI
jgi:hypothetical protein